MATNQPSLRWTVPPPRGWRAEQLQGEVLSESGMSGRIPEVNIAVSPSLVSGNPSLSAHEVKFLITRDRAAGVLDWAKSRFQTDPYSRPKAGGGYSISSLYLDTPDFAVYRKHGSFGRAKFRIRRYGVSKRVFLERKLKVGDKVSKRRSDLAIDELPGLDLTGAKQSGGSAAWYEKRLHLRGLRVVCQISYERIALVGSNEWGPLRLTLDEAVHVVRMEEPRFAEPGTGELLLENHMILELKFRGKMPAVFKELAQFLTLQPGAVSKYRLGLFKLGCAPDLQVNGGGRVAPHHA